MVFPEPGLEVLELVRDADVGVLMTNPALACEGLSNSIMEYMALGLPVVCGDGGGNRELVEDGITGFVIPPADPAPLVERLTYLHDHEEVRRAMGAAGRARISRDFSVDTMIRRMLDVYAEAIDAVQAGGSASVRVGLLRTLRTAPDDRLLRHSQPSALLPARHPRSAARGTGPMRTATCRTGEGPCRGPPSGRSPIRLTS